MFAEAGLKHGQLRTISVCITFNKPRGLKPLLSKILPAASER
jgi:hypothetical protein